jgi:hypothetical protein
VLVLPLPSARSLRGLGCRWPCTAGKTPSRRISLSAKSTLRANKELAGYSNVASPILVESRRWKGVVNVSSSGIFVEFLAKDDLESLSPWRSFTPPRLHPWTSLAFAFDNLRDWLVPDRLPWRRSPLARLKPDVAGVEVSKERTIAEPIVSRPDHPLR